MAQPFRLAAAGDLHCRDEQHGRFREMVKAVNGEAEGLVLCGDLTDRGLVEEARTLAEALSLLRVPCAAVLGNHDYEAGHQHEIVRILRDAKVAVLDGEYTILDRRLGVAYAARGSAQLGLGRVMEAAHDYRAALELEPGLAMPLYGLAECYRAMRDSRAADLYRQYAESRAADVREDLRTLAVRRAAERVLH